MLRLTTPAVEMWDESEEKFIQVKAQTLQLEHSLVSLSKWESKWKKAFLTSKDKTEEEVLDYIKCMTLTQNVNPLVYVCLSEQNIALVKAYIEDPMTATYFSESSSSKKNREVVTSELIYCWMIALNIPLECQKWHLNRLMTLIRVCSIKNQPPKKKSKSEIMRSNAALNAARRKKYNTKG